MTIMVFVYMFFVQREHVLLSYVKHDLAFWFLRETWFLALFCEREAVSRIFRDAWKGQLLLHEAVFRRGIGDPLVTIYAFILGMVAEVSVYNKKGGFQRHF